MLDYFEISQTRQALIALAVITAMFLLFVRESYPTEVVAISGAAAMLVLGLLPLESALGVLSNPAPWTIAAMFIVMGALVRTGALDAFTALADRRAQENPKIAIGMLLGFAALSSAFISNTPVVVVLIPVFVQLARSLKIPASKFLIPLSYVSILGGTLTLLGTSTNLLVDGVARAHGMQPFSLFEVTPLGMILVVWGALYLRFIGPLVLPERSSMADMLPNRTGMKFFTEVVIPPESDLIGRDVTDVQLFQRDGVRLLDVIRGDLSLRRNLKQVRLQVGDHVVLRTKISELLNLQRDKRVAQVNQLSAVETTTAEVLVTPGSKMVGRSLGALRLRRRFGVYTIALHRRNQNLVKKLDDLTIRVGDTLLLEGSPEDIRRLSAEMGLVDVARPMPRAFRRGHAPFAILALLGIIICAGLGVAPIFMLAVVAVALILIARCIDSDEAFSFVDGRLLALIFSMLVVGSALEASGAVQLIVTVITPVLGNLPDAMVVWAIFLLTSILTELVSNNAVAVVVTPIAIALAEAMGIDARPLVVAVMVAASASFSTPIGYQTNTLVYGPGGYRFSDFMRVGIPLNLSIGLLSSLLIPFLWPL